MLHRLCLLVASLALISASEPPSQVPVPQPKPGEGQSSTPEKPAEEKQQTPVEAPKPAPKPQVPDEQKPDAEKPPAEKGSDDPKMEGEGKDGAEQQKPADEAAKPEMPREPVKPEDPAALQACLGALKEIGAEFKSLSPSATRSRAVASKRLSSFP